MKKIPRRILFLIVALLTVFVVLGCAENQSSRTFNKNSGGVGFFQSLFSKPVQPLMDFERTGTKALDVKLLKDMPPVSPDGVFEGDDFKIAVYLKNLGAADIEDGMINIINADRADIEITPSAGQENKNQFMLKGLSINNPIGEGKVLYFDGKVLGQTLTKKTELGIDTCFTYRTEASASICLTNSNELKLTAGCKVKDISLSNGQGAPIAIKKIAPKMTEKGKDNLKYDFLIYLDNLGPGKVGERSENCEGDEKIYVESITLNGKSLGNGITCKNLEKEKDGRRFITLIDTEDKTVTDKEDIIKCTITFDKNGINGDLISPLVVILKYGYLQNLERTLKIKDSLDIEDEENEDEDQIPLPLPSAPENTPRSEDIT